jgi:hypothetical protein
MIFYFVKRIYSFSFVDLMARSADKKIDLHGPAIQAITHAFLQKTIGLVCKWFANCLSTIATIAKIRRDILAKKKRILIFIPHLKAQRAWMAI